MVAPIIAKLAADVTNKDRAKPNLVWCGKRDTQNRASAPGAARLVLCFEFVCKNIDTKYFKLVVSVINFCAIKNTVYIVKSKYYPKLLAKCYPIKSRYFPNADQNNVYTLCNTV